MASHWYAKYKVESAKNSYSGLGCIQCHFEVIIFCFDILQTFAQNVKVTNLNHENGKNFHLAIKILYVI